MFSDCGPFQKGKIIFMFMGRDLHNDCRQIYFQDDLCLCLKSPCVVNSNFGGHLTK